MKNNKMMEDSDKDALARCSKPKTSDTWTESGLESNTYELANEVPVAIVFNGITAAVMMASPADIADFALGFAITEGYISNASEVVSFQEIPRRDGIIARFWVNDLAKEEIAERKRAALGPMGCGLCGIDSLEQAIRPLPKVGSGTAFTAKDITSASDSLRSFQALHDKTHSAHAAGFLLPNQGVIVAKEDVGRHNALDKLCGTLARKETDIQGGAMIMTSRLSVDLVQKAAMVNCSMLIGVSAPSSLAVEMAENTNMTLIAFCRSERFEVFTGSQRISD